MTWPSPPGTAITEGPLSPELATAGSGARRRRDPRGRRGTALRGRPAAGAARQRRAGPRPDPDVRRRHAGGVRAPGRPRRGGAGRRRERRARRPPRLPAPRLRHGAQLRAARGRGRDRRPALGPRRAARRGRAREVRRVHQVPGAVADADAPGGGARRRSGRSARGDDPHLRARFGRGSLAGGQPPRVRPSSRAGRLDHGGSPAAGGRAVVRPGRLLPRRAGRPAGGVPLDEGAPRRRRRRRARSARSTWWASTPASRAAASGAR